MTCSSPPTYLPCLQYVLDAAYRLDPLVEDKIVIEVKAVERLLPVHEAQVLTYLRLTESPAGLLMSLNVPKLVDGVKRLINPNIARLG